MHSFYLESTSYNGDIACPYCGQDYDVLWESEYGEPIDGSYTIDCPCYHTEFAMNVYTITNYGVLPGGS